MSSASSPALVPRAARSLLNEVRAGYPVVTLTGPRQSGKTTLAQLAFADKPYVSLETPDDREFAHTDPRGFLARFPAGAIIDEVQHVPGLLSWIQTEVDARQQMGRYVLTGSQNLSLMAHIGQSLAGRSALIQLLPLSLAELGAAGRLPTDEQALDATLLRGGYPSLYARPVAPARWYADYVMSYLERDVRQITQVHDLSAFQRFLKLCAGRTGQLLNLANLAVETGIAQSTARAGCRCFRPVTWSFCCRRTIATWASEWSRRPSCISSTPAWRRRCWASPSRRNWHHTPCAVPCSRRWSWASF